MWEHVPYADQDNQLLHVGTHNVSGDANDAAGSGHRRDGARRRDSTVLDDPAGPVTVTTVATVPPATVRVAPGSVVTTGARKTSWPSTVSVEDGTVTL
jgi:hypothetical protein